MGPPIANPFLAEAAAALYRRGRLDHHLQAVAAIQDLVGEERATCGLDVGCGTGLSSAALGSLCNFTVGLDSAPTMIGVAAEDTGLPYLVALAETIPFRQFVPEDAIAPPSSSARWLY